MGILINFGIGLLLIIIWFAIMAMLIGWLAVGLFIHAHERFWMRRNLFRIDRIDTGKTN